MSTADSESNRRISSRFTLGASVVAAAATAGVVVLAALTSWWVLFALLAVCPPVMMVGCPLVLAAMGRPTGRLWAAGPCGAWLTRAMWGD